MPPALFAAASMADIDNSLKNTFLKNLRVDQDANQAFADLSKMFTAWNNLPSSVTSAIWKNAASIPGLTQIQTVAQQISQASEDSIRTQLDSLLQKVDFPNNPVVQWLEAATSKSLFELYESGQLQALRNAASALTSLLDGAKVQSTLASLKTQVDKVLSLPALETALTNKDLSAIAMWVVQQLAKFLGVDISKINAEIDKVNHAIETIRNKAQEIYTATWKALNTTYGFSINYAYTLSDTQSVLIDAVFADAARAHLAAALAGDFSKILTAPVAGVTLGTATLTHGIERHTHVETHLPWWTGASDDLAKGYATSKLADGVDGRVQFYEAGATDTVISVSGTRLRRFASCSIGISGQAQKAGVRQYNLKAVDFGYSFAIAKASMTRSEFGYDFGAAADQYFPNAFGDESPDSNHAVFNSWVVDWDKFTDHVAGMPGGDSVIGNTWTNLQVRSRAGSGTDWVSALLNGTKPDYMAMSRAMQTAIRRWLLISYAGDPTRFKNIPGKNGVSAFLVYTAMPAKNGYFLKDSDTLASDPTRIVWDVRDIDLATAMTTTFAPQPLSLNLANIYALLNGIPALKGSAQYYRDAGGMIADVVRELGVSDPYIAMLQNEKAAIDAAQSAFEGLRKSSGQQLQNALPVLSVALTELVSSFNRGLSSLSLDAPGVMQSFAPLIFQQAVAVMFSSAAPLSIDALLDVAVLKPDVALPGNDQEPTIDQILMRQRITNFS